MAQPVILWQGGEDINFPNGAAVSWDASAGRFRSTFSRGALYQSTIGGFSESTPFSGGAVNSLWFRCRCWSVDVSNVQQLIIGPAKAGTNKGLYVGSSNANAGKWAISKYDGTTKTQLATESGTSRANQILQEVVMQIVGPLSAATVNVWIDQTLLITFTGDISISGVSAYDCVKYTRDSTGFCELSEIQVADGDIRAWPGLLTAALTGGGTTNQWTNNTYTNINGTVISDSSPTSDNVNGEEQQYNITDLPAGSFVIAATSIHARVAKSATPSVTKVALGYNKAGTVTYGASQPAGTGYGTIEQIDQGLFTQADMNSLQLSVKAVT